MPDDPRLDLARAIPIADIAARLPLDTLRREGRELVGPCPACGGKDRFSINPDKGVFFCRGCDAKGDGLALVRHVLGCDFKAALAHLAGAAVEIDPAEKRRRAEAAARARRKQEEASARYRAQAIADARSIWSRALPIAGTEAETYLARRAIRLPQFPPALRFIPDYPCVRKIDRRLVTVFRGPCMIAAIQGGDGHLAAVHQTWIDLATPKGRAKIDYMGETYSSKLIRGSKKGGTIRLGGTKGATTMIMGEGIETTLSARVLAPYGPALYWAGVDLDNMAGLMRKIAGVQHSGLPDLSDENALRIPPEISRLVLIQDGDSAPKMTRAKLLSCARRAQATRPDLITEIIHPGEGRDLNDALREERKNP